MYKTPYSSVGLGLRLPPRQKLDDRRTTGAIPGQVQRSLASTSSQAEVGAMPQQQLTGLWTCPVGGKHQRRHTSGDETRSMVMVKVSMHVLQLVDRDVVIEKPDQAFRKIIGVVQ